MDGLKFISLLFLLSVIGLSTQTPVELDNALEGGDVIEVEDTTTVAVVTRAEDSTADVETFETESPHQKNFTTNSPCSSARNKPGRCVARQQCEYSTPAIDFTLYAPKVYVRPCSPEEVCCPLDALIQVAETVSQPADTDVNFDFDADD